MPHLQKHALAFFIVVILLFPAGAFCQKALTWQEVRDKFEASNPTMLAARIGIEESRADEITAYLRPNPQFAVSADQIGANDSANPFENTLPVASTSYLHERRHKRELRRESAQKETGIATTLLADQERSLLFTLRNAFVQALQQKAIFDLARENLAYYDHVLQVSADRFRAGDIAQVDLDRLQLQRAQYESDLQTSGESLETAKIQLLTLLNDRTPVDQFDVSGPFEFPDQISPLEEFRRMALEARPDLKAAARAIDKARTDHNLAVANGSTDPVFGLDVGLPFLTSASQSYASPLYEYVGVNVSIPLRIFDRNQGEKLRTQLDVGRTERLRDAVAAQVFGDVDSAYASVNSDLVLLRPYKAQYLQQAVRVRDTVTFSYQRGGASLLDFLNAQNEYRSIQRNYLNLIGSYLAAASQLNLAVGREVVP
jgi:cobalt-zinc-cadmium efflux system outer membrane protein